MDKKKNGNYREGTKGFRCFLCANSIFSKFKNDVHYWCNFRKQYVNAVSCCDEFTTKRASDEIPPNSD